MSTPKSKDSPSALALTAAKGFCMGAADVVPGVSGGTMAFILGIYQRLLEAIRAFDLTAARLALTFKLRELIDRVDLVFLLALGLGIGSALLFFTRVVPLPTLIRTHPEHIYALFFGLIAGSIVILVRELGRLSANDWIAIVAGALVGFAVINMVPFETPEASWFVFVAGALAISAMILPGVSGSFILLLLQKYAYIFDAIGRFDFSIIIPFGLGCATGLLLFSRILAWLLRHFYRATLVTIIGILVASLWRIWPFQDRQYVVVRDKERLMASFPEIPCQFADTEIAALGLALLGLVAVLMLQFIATRKRAP
tara:strand:- start:2260 stop:3195 length:936 start_codon:yes stop_codon:yes gene_type:complete